MKLTEYPLRDQTIQKTQMYAACARAPCGCPDGSTAANATSMAAGDGWRRNAHESLRWKQGLA